MYMNSQEKLQISTNYQIIGKFMIIIFIVPIFIKL